MAEVSVFARMIGKNRHFRDLSQQVLFGVVDVSIYSRCFADVKARGGGSFTMSKMEF